MTSCPEAQTILEFEKKPVSLDLNSERVSWDSSLEEGSRFLGSTKCAARLLSQWVEGWRCTNSQHRKKLCPSLLMSKNLKIIKEIKSFVPETISSVFGFLDALWTWWTFFTYMNISYTHIWLCNIFSKEKYLHRLIYKWVVKFLFYTKRSFGFFF